GRIIHWGQNVRGIRSSLLIELESFFASEAKQSIPGPDPTVVCRCATRLPMTPVPKEPEAVVLALEGREVRVTHPDKLYFSRQARLTKLDLVRYFLSIAPGALAGIRDRPLVLKRFVDGAEGVPFYQKRAPSARPEWLRTVTLAFSSGRTAEELVIDDAAGLAFAVNL